jgi:hypothetical protein
MYICSLFPSSSTSVSFSFWLPLTLIPH